MSLPHHIDARRYSRAAKQRLAEAKVILVKAELPAAAEYLAGYAVECILKALVITTTPAAERPPPGARTIDWLKRDFGHDLNSLRLAAGRRGSVMPRDIAGEFAITQSWDPESRYDPTPGDPETADRFLAAAEAVVKWADGRM